MEPMINAKQAYCLPGARLDRRTTGFGIYAEDGRLLPHSDIRTASWTTRPQAEAKLVGEVNRVMGPALFAGSVDKQFGFVLLNSLGRLWALEDLPPETSVVFAAKPISQRVTYGVLGHVLRGLGLRNPIFIVETATAFEDLYLAEERFGECRGGTGTEAFYHWIDRRFPPGKKMPRRDRAVYVTRSGLGPMAGRFACEDHLERLLAAEGYEIFAPEAHSIKDQVATFQSAGRLIFAESSALHLYGLVRRPGQMAAIVQRRPDLPAVMTAQLADRDGTAPLAINAISEVWWPPLRGEHLGRSVLDFSRLHKALREAGLITATSWPEPEPDEVARSLRAGLAENETVMDARARADWLAEMRERKRG